MKTIYKYCLEVTDKQIINVKKNSQFLTVGMSPEKELAIWFLVDSDEIDVEITIYIVGDGNPMFPSTLAEAYYLGTVKQDCFMWHIFTQPSANSVIPI